MQDVVIVAATRTAIGKQVPGRAGGMLPRRQVTANTGEVMSETERQQSYTERQKESGKHINMALNRTAKLQYERLAKHYGVTQRQMLATVLAEAERRAVESMGNKPAYCDS